MRGKAPIRALCQTRFACFRPASLYHQHANRIEREVSKQPTNMANIIYVCNIGKVEHSRALYLHSSGERARERSMFDSALYFAPQTSVGISSPANICVFVLSLAHPLQFDCRYKDYCLWLYTGASALSRVLKIIYWIQQQALREFVSGESTQRAPITPRLAAQSTH